MFKLFAHVLNLINHNHSNRQLWLILITVILLLFLPPEQLSAAPSQNDNPAFFKEADCMMDLPFGVIEGTQVKCGYLTVPEQHQNPEGPTIRLAVAIIKNMGFDQSARPDPLVIAQGGPGGSTISTYTELLLAKPLWINRDIILFDQRGTRYSEPNLYCNELFDLTIETLNQDISIEEGIRMSLDATETCRQRLADEGINMAAYNSLENAADINTLRQTLGYEQINLYGVSYGTLLALHTMRDYPDGLRSVILDAVIPPQINFITESPQTVNRAFNQFFEVCTNSSVCQNQHPDLEKRFFALVNRLNEQPAIFTLTDPETGNNYETLLNGDTLTTLLFQFLYSTELIPLLPRLIDNIEAEDYAMLSNVWPMLLFDRSMSYGMYYSVMCAEDADFVIEDVNLSGVRPELLKNIEIEFTSFQEACQIWDVPDLGAMIDEPVSSDIPTLILSGNLDPITPPPYADETAKTLSNSYRYTFPTNGHGAMRLPCPNEIIISFLNNPTVEPDSACLDQLSTTPDYIPSSTLDIPVLIPLLMGNSSYLLQGGLLFLTLLGLLSAWMIWPVMLIVHRIRHQQFSNHPSTAQFAKWLVILIGLFAGLFLAGFLTVTISVALSNETILFVGLPIWSFPLFLLPILLNILVLILIVMTVIIWRNGYWSIWSRLYYTMLTLLAIVHVGILSWWGMMTVFI